MVFPPSPIIPDSSTGASDIAGPTGDDRQLVLLSAGSSRTHDDSSSHRPQLPKMEFTRFDGTDARIWIDKCTAYFAMFQIPEGFQVTAATMYLDGHAAHWFQAYKDSYGVLSWDQFQSAVLTEFDIYYQPQRYD